MSLQDKIKNAEETMWPLTIDDVELWAEQNNFTIVEDEWWKNAQDTMRKYQKIADLYDYWRSGKCEYTISCMENIGKVLKDGENNN